MPAAPPDSTRATRPAPRYSFAFGGGALLGFVLGYGVAFLKLVPVLRYLPEVGTWTFTPPPDAISMGWYGILLWALVGSGLGYLADRARPSRQRTLLWLGVASALGLMVYIVWHEGTRWGVWV
ncbi:MAG: hypothetical protein RhofKO_38480 [Rhodothermales bacterium]